MRAMALLIPLLAGAPPGEAAATAPQVAAAAPYTVYAEGLDPVEIARMLGGLHADLTRHFGRSPKPGLSVAVYASRRTFADALTRDRQPAPRSAGGYYSPSTRKVYLYAQPSAYFTRQLILHECTHQFHWLVATGNRAPSAGWYTEGLAEYFAMHNWDGRRLRTGVVPAITLEDYPAKALEAFEAAGRDLEAVATCQVPCGRPLAWALVHFLMNAHEGRFRELSRRLDRRDDPAAAWRAVFADTAPALGEALRRWIEQHAQPWRIVWTAWQQRGEAIEGRSATNALAVLKQTPARLTVDVEPVGDKLKAGLAFAYRSPEDFHLFQVVEGGRYRVLRRKGTVWVLLSHGRVPAPTTTATTRPAQTVELTVVAGDDGATLFANGRQVERVAVTGQVGLNVDACIARFRVLEP